MMLHSPSLAALDYVAIIARPLSAVFSLAVFPAMFSMIPTLVAGKQETIKWACELDRPYRLIFEPHEDPIPEDENGKYIRLEIKGVEIIEIINYHGK